MPMPAAMSPAPPVTSARRTPVVAARAWSHDPEAQVTAAAERAIPPIVTVPPRSSTTVSGTNASVPKKAKVIAKAATGTAGLPAARRRLPLGSRCRSALSPSQAPRAASPIASGRAPIVSAASSSVEPMARRNASTARRASLR